MGVHVLTWFYLWGVSKSDPLKVLELIFNFTHLCFLGSPTLSHTIKCLHCLLKSTESKPWAELAGQIWITWFYNRSSLGLWKQDNKKDSLYCKDKHLSRSQILLQYRLGSSPSQWPQLDMRDVFVLLQPQLWFLTQYHHRPPIRLLGTLHMHRKEEKDQPWQKIELNSCFFFLLMKQQNVMEQFVFAWSNVSQGAASARKLILRAFARVLPTLWKFSAGMLVQASHIAISTRKPGTLRWPLWSLRFYYNYSCDFF